MAKYRFTFPNFAEHILLKRQVFKDSDTFIIIYGRERSGKTTLGFNLLIPYVEMMKRIHNGTYTPDWLPEDYDLDELWDPHPPDGERVKWSHILKSYFAGTAQEMEEQIKDNQKGSPIFVDEGTDVASWHEQMKSEQKSLVRLTKKSAKLHMPTIFITPSEKLLTNDILRRAHYMFMVMEEPNVQEGGNHAYLFRNYDIPIMAERQPFGFDNIAKDLEKNKYLRKNQSALKNYLMNSEQFKALVHFKAIDDQLYELYDKLVKDPLLMKQEQKSSVPRGKYDKVKYMLDTILYNLYHKDDKSYAQIHRLLIDKFGSSLTSRSTVTKYIEEMETREVPPEIKGDKVLDSGEKGVEPDEDEWEDVSQDIVAEATQEKNEVSVSE